MRRPVPSVVDSENRLHTSRDPINRRLPAPHVCACAQSQRLPCKTSHAETQPLCSASCHDLRQNEGLFSHLISANPPLAEDTPRGTRPAVNFADTTSCSILKASHGRSRITCGARSAICIVPSVSLHSTLSVCGSRLQHRDHVSPLLRLAHCF